MAELNRVLADNLALVIGAIAALVLVLIALVVVQSVRVGRAERRYRALVRDEEGGSLANVLERQAGRVAEVSMRLDDLDRQERSLEDRTLASVQHIGLVRFNPFEDTGSDQSFALALLDGRGDGLVISSLHGRGGTRIFAKEIQNGASRYTLSDEEAQAIRAAVDRSASPTPSA
jgi:hypothetical protein